MTEKLNEMDDSYADGDYSAMPSESPDQVISLPAIELVANGSADGTVAMGSPETAPDPAETVSIYVDSFTPVSYSTTDSVVGFDVVFNVSIYSGSQTETYKVVKRIGVDRQKLAAEARNSTPVSIVEDKKPVVNEAFSAKRMRALAGLN